MEQRVMLEVSTEQDCFHFNTDTSGYPFNESWERIGVTSWETASQFAKHIYDSYDNHVPDIETIKREWRQFL